MANGIIQVPLDSTGKKIDTSEVVVGSNLVERQNIVLADPLIPGGLAQITNTTPAAAAQALVTRPLLYDSGGNALLSDSGALRSSLYAGGNQVASPSSATADGFSPSAGQSLVGVANIGPSLWNGASWDRQYGNTIGTILASAARTAAVSGPLITNFNSRGVILYLYISVTNATTTFRLVIESPDPTSGAILQISPASISPTPNTLGIFGYMFYPGANAQGGAGITGYIIQSAPIAIPRLWRASMYPSDASSVTYSLSYALIN